MLIALVKVRRLPNGSLIDIFVLPQVMFSSPGRAYTPASSRM